MFGDLFKQDLNDLRPVDRKTSLSKEIFDQFWI